jgi:sulfide:quinone oxidoreductase
MDPRGPLIYGPGMSEPIRSGVLIVGGGVAGLETMMALRALAGDRVQVTLVAPETAFTYRPMKVAEPFYQRHAREYELAEIARDHGAGLVHESVARVHTKQRVVRCASGRELAYQFLVVAVGARAFSPFADAITFGEDPSEERLHGMLADLEGGYLRQVAFLVPGETAWTLPIYELTLMTARQVWGMGIDEAQFSLVTPEERPLAMFGRAASDAVAELLAIEFVGSSYPTAGRGYVVADPSGRRIDVERVVSLPALEGIRLDGLPVDANGFIHVDPHGRVWGLANVYAAGDGTAFPIKQGGLATQQADAVAQAIAAELGAPVAPEPFRPVLRGLLFTGGEDRYMRRTIVGAAVEGEQAAHTLWWPPSKIAGRYLSRYLLDRDEVGTHAAGTHSDADADRLTVEIPLDSPGA